MTNNTHSIVELGLELTSIKRSIALIMEKEQQTPDQQEKDALEEQRRSLQNRETALINEIKRLKEIKRRQESRSR